MYENMSVDSIRARMLESVPDKFDKREGSVIFDAISPAAMEIQFLYIELERIIKESYSDTASREFLILRCKERGISPYPATNAVLRGVFTPITVDVTGKRFNIGSVNYVVAEKITDGEYKVECETAGSVGNQYLGQMIPIDYVEGLETAELTQILIYGEDEEDTEALRQRYLDSFQNQSYGFNRSQYISVTEALPGVGSCKPIRAWNGPGTVKLIITDSNFAPPSPELIDSVQTAIDPMPNSGAGAGLAPIDHEVTVIGVTGKAINIETSLTFAPGWSLEAVLPYIEAALDTYYSELNSTWGQEKSLLVRVSQVESRILSLDGIIDISETKINGLAQNALLSFDEVAVRGEFSSE